MVSDVLLGENVTSPGGKYLVYQAWQAAQQPGNGAYVLVGVLILAITLYFIFKD